jgi:hypothetical protein
MRKLLPTMSQRLLGLALLGALTTTLACSDLPIHPIRKDLADQLWDVRIEPRAITMSTVAPYDTITLRTIAWNGVGDTITDDLEVRYHSVTDTTVRISDDGVLTVRTRTNTRGIKIVASVTYNKATRTDTATVVVTTEPTPPRIIDSIVLETVDNLTREPTPPVWSIAGLTAPLIVPRVLSNGATVSNVPLSYTSSDQAIILVDPWTGAVTPQLKGTAHITATTTWYGTTYKKTLDVRVIGPLNGTFRIHERIPRGSDTAVVVITPQEIELEVGAYITWLNERQRPVEIIFDDPTHVEQFTGPIMQYYQTICLFLGRLCNVGQSGGNVIIPAPNPEVDPSTPLDIRYIAVPGTYRFRTESGGTGTIIIKSSLPDIATH